MRCPFIRSASLSVLITCIGMGLAPAPIAAQGFWKKLKEQVKQAEEQAKQPQQRQSQPQPGQQQNERRNSSPQQQAQASSGGNPGAGSFTPPPGTKVEQKAMAPLQSGAKFYISPHGVHVATVEAAGSRAVVYYDGAEGPLFDEILSVSPEGSRPTQIIFSPDGKHFAYFGRSADQFVLMVDGKEMARGSGSLQGTLGFTSNSQHFVYSVTPGPPTEVFQFVFDGKPAPDSTGQISPVFSPDGNHYAYLLQQRDREHWNLVVDGKISPYFGGNPQWSADSRHLYTTVPHSGANPYVEILMDGRPYLRGQGVELHIPPVGNMTVAVVTEEINYHPEYFLSVGGRKIPGSEVSGSFARIDMVTFSPDGKHYAVRLTNAQNRQYALVDGKRGLEYQNVDRLAFTADSSKAVYTAFNNNKGYVIYGGQESNPCIPSLTDGVILAPAGNQAATLCGMTGGAPDVFLNGKTLPYPPGVQGGAQLRFTPDGQHYVYVASYRGGGQGLVIDGIEQKASNLPAEVGKLYDISSDSEHIAAASGPPNSRGGSGIFLDGKFIATDDSPIVGTIGFSPDCKHLAWAEMEHGVGAVGDHFFIGFYVDGKLIAKTTAAVNPNLDSGWWGFAPDGNLNFIGQNDNSIERFTVTPSPSMSLETLLSGLQ
jgi:hypothetical protein